MLCMLFSLGLGLVIALLYMFRNTYSKSFVVTLALLPISVQMVILLVNGNLGAGVAVMGAFSLVRFRSAPGSAREICAIFFAMAVGLATGMGYLGAAVVFVVVVGAASLLYAAVGLGEQKQAKTLKITIPEDLDYTDLFADLLAQYTQKWELIEVRTSNMGSLYRLEYRIVLRDKGKEKEFIDAVRCRNGNLEVSCGRIAAQREEL
ncbi:MAG TPA: DUF4956 domain-containing protein [Candidatus Gallacutalibacter stercoravium]|nr:DUF4956 domain-containing protein [Candidatus Gallacutalibacter stercoravium]